MLTHEARGLHYAGGQRQKKRVFDAGDDAPMDRDACVGLSASHAADGAEGVLSRDGDVLRVVRDECEWLVLPGPPAGHRGYSDPSVFF